MQEKRRGETTIKGAEMNANKALWEQGDFSRIAASSA
jgi:hypothetical protein